MAKLYPPYVEGTIPACAGTVLTVPFSMNRAVGEREVKSFILKLKTVQNSILIKNIPCSSFTFDPEYIATFDVSELGLKVGQYYKAQLAYVDENGITGHFSTVGVFKYTADPLLQIEHLSMSEVNKHRGTYIGYYSQKNLDPSEKVYSYRFKLFDSNGALVEDSGELLHNSEVDDSNEELHPYESYDRYTFYTDLETNQSYYVNYSITTLNGYKKSSPRYRIIQAKSIPPEITASLKAELNFDNGYISVYSIGEKDPDTGIEYVTAGSFIITRKSNLPEARWEEVLRFSLQAEVPSRHLLNDCTVQQGVSYIYSLQQYNDNGLYSERLLSNWVDVDFEDAFLYDGKRQLKIRYNPKVSSFKNNILESKVDTLGSKHPFIFRNGSVNYKEFPISGLISYYMDEENLFMSEEEFTKKEKTTNLIGDNIAAERNFKLAVLEWLTNGEPKLFRSPTEGNYIVRLMNTSLTPNDTVGRMLHTFSSTAYEIDDCNYENLGKYNILQIKELDTTRLRWMTKEFRLLVTEIDPNDKSKSVKLNEFPAESVSFVDMIPGDMVYLDGKEYMIGATGGYSFNVSKPVQEIRVSMNNSGQGSLTYSFYSKANTIYELVNDVTIRDVAAHQFIGRTTGGNIVGQIENARDTILEFFSLQFKKRPVYNAFYKDNIITELYEDTNCTIPLTKDDLDSFALYQVRNATDTLNGKTPPAEIDKADYYIDRQFDHYYPKVGYFYDGNIPSLWGRQTGRIPESAYSCTFKLNDNEMDLTLTEGFETGNIKQVKNIELSYGVWLECAYQLRQVDYHLQYDKENYPECANAWSAYQTAKRIYDIQTKSIDNISDENLASQKDSYWERRDLFGRDVKTTYGVFVEELKLAIADYKENNGIVW